MKRAWLILVAGLIAAAAAYTGIYRAGTARQRAVENSNQPALSWLQQEYHLSDAQFAAVQKLYEAYEPQCAERCQKIDQANTRIEQLLSATNTVTPEIRDALAQAARLRSECQSAMLAHFYAVARQMPPQDAKRYLAWVQQATLTPAQMLPMKQPSSMDAP